MKIFLGTDHAGFELKQKLLEYLTKHDYDVEDIGARSLDPDDDYPQFAFRAVTKVLGSDDSDPRAILICGSGQGMCIAANRVRGIRAALVWNPHQAKETRLDNDSNVLCLPARELNEDETFGIVETWLSTSFSKAPRHLRRIREIEEIYG